MFLCVLIPVGPERISQNQSLVLKKVYWGQIKVFFFFFGTEVCPIPPPQFTTTKCVRVDLCQVNKGNL